jgi:ribose transport system permease protein
MGPARPFLAQGIMLVAASSPPEIPKAEPLGVPVIGRRESIESWIATRADLVLRLGLFLIIIAFAIFFTLRTIPTGNLSDVGQATFISTDNLQNIGRQMAVVGVIALGETFVIITAGIDLSVGSLLGLSGVLAANAMVDGWPAAVAVVVILLFGLGIGLINGTLVHVGGIPPFIVTLGMLGILRGIAYLTTSGLNVAIPLNPSGDPEPFAAWVDNSFLNIPDIFLVLAALAIVAGLILRFTRRGRYIYSYGSNPEAARRAGINVRVTILTVYAVSGVMAAVAGLLLTGRFGTANPNAGTSYELDAIAAAVLGGASLFGARGSIMGTFLGVVLVNMLANGIDLINIDPHMQQVIEGLLLISIVWLDQWRKRRLQSV